MIINHLGNTTAGFFERDSVRKLLFGENLHFSSYTIGDSWLTYTLYIRVFVVIFGYHILIVCQCKNTNNISNEYYFHFLHQYFKERSIIVVVIPSGESCSR